MARALTPGRRLSGPPQAAQTRDAALFDVAWCAGLGASSVVATDGSGSILGELKLPLF